MVRVLSAMPHLIAVLLLTLVSNSLLAQDPVVHPLFKIERSKNANIIQYDARSGPDGKLLKRKPIVGYWIRLNEQGQRKKLTWVQRTFAFGFKTRLAKGRESAEMSMVFDLVAPVSVIRDRGVYRATIPIEGRAAYLEKVFVKASRKGLKVNVKYVEIFGRDVETGEDRYQKIVP